MADNTELNAGSGGDTISTDDIAGVKVQRVKVQYGVDGSATDVSDSNPLPIDDAGGSITVDGTVSVSGTVTVDGSGVTQPVSGTVTANLGATDNAVLDSIDAAVNGTLTVGSHAVTNAGTFAVQESRAHTADFDTGAGTDTTAAFGIAVPASGGAAVVPGDATAGLKVDLGADNDVTVTGTVTSVGAAAENAAVSGNPVLAGGRYDSSARTLGNGDVGAVALNASGQLLVEIAAGAGSGGTSAADDADFTAASTSGTPVMGAYQSSPTAVTDGDLGIVGITANRELKVSVTSYADSQTDDAAFTPGTDSVAMIGATFDDTTPDSVDEGDGGAVRMSANRNLYTTIRDAAGNERGLNIDANGAIAVTDGSGSLTVDGTVAATQSGTWNVTNISGTVSLPTGASTAANQSTMITALQLIDNPVLAHDTAVGTTQTMMAGARATNNIEGLTQVAANDGTRVTADLNGCLVTRPHTTPEEHISERISDTTGTSTNFTNFAAGGAGIHNYVCDVTITNTSSTDGYVDLRDGSAGSVIWTFPAPANSGATHSFSLPLKGAANTALAYDVSAALTTVYISVNGFQAQG